MTTYDFMCNHLKSVCQDAIPAMDEYLTAWVKGSDPRKEKHMICLTKGGADLWVRDQNISRRSKSVL